MTDKLRQALGFPDRYRAIREHAKTAISCVMSLESLAGIEPGTTLTIGKNRSDTEMAMHRVLVVKIIDKHRVVVTNV